MVSSGRVKTFRRGCADEEERGTDSNIGTAKKKTRERCTGKSDRGRIRRRRIRFRRLVRRRPCQRWAIGAVIEGPLGVVLFMMRSAADCISRGQFPDV